MGTNDYFVCNYKGARILLSGFVTGYREVD